MRAAPGAGIGHAIAQIILLCLLVTPAMATVALKPIYANEASNWALETFAANGLFQQIARYQKGHPKAVELQAGSFTLDTLAQQVGPAVLSATHDGWVLHYPLVIGPAASLTLDSVRLYINGEHGGCLINRGTLSILGSHIESSANEQSGFIHGWGGSSTHIESSTLSGLGRNDYRAYGLSIARHRYQRSKAARLQLHDSQLVALYRGLNAESGSQVTVSGLAISDSREQGLVLDGANETRIHALEVQHSQGHGMRVQGQGTLTLEQATLTNNHGAGLLLENHFGAVTIHRLHSQHNREYGLQFKNGDSTASALLTDLTLVDNGLDGLRLDNGPQLSLRDAVIERNKRYGLSLDGQQQGISASLRGLQLHHNHLAALHTRGEGVIEIGATSLRHHSNRGQYLAGNISARESELLPLLINAQAITLRFTEAMPTGRLVSHR